MSEQNVISVNLPELLRLKSNIDKNFKVKGPNHFSFWLIALLDKQFFSSTVIPYLFKNESSLKDWSDAYFATIFLEFTKIYQLNGATKVSIDGGYYVTFMNWVSIVEFNPFKGDLTALGIQDSEEKKLMSMTVKINQLTGEVTP